MLVLSEQDVRKVLTMADCLDINKSAYMSITSASSKVGGKGNVPTRISLPGPPQPGASEGGAPDCTLFKPAAFYADDQASSSNVETLVGMKIISLRSENPKKGYPLAPATVAVLDADSGIVQAIVSSTYLTGARTAAGSGLATQLARPDLEHLVVFGAGLQAEMHIDAIQTAIGRDIPKITIVNRSAERANRLKESLPSGIS
jgi:ornithine cyclodeaminase